MFDARYRQTTQTVKMKQRPLPADLVKRTSTAAKIDATQSRRASGRDVDHPRKTVTLKTRIGMVADSCCNRGVTTKEVFACIAE